MQIVKIPTLGGNEDSATVHWLVEDKKSLRVGEPFCSLITSKANFELQAEAAGFIHLLCDNEANLIYDTVIAVITDSADADKAQLKALANPPKLEAGGERKWSKKAEILAKSKGIDIATIKPTGEIVSVADVEKAIAEQEASFQNQSLFRRLIRGIDLQDVSLPEGVDDDESGKVSEDFYQLLRKDPAAFAQLDSSEKLERYRSAGAVIGEGVVFAPGAFVNARQVIIGDGCFFGKDTRLHCRDKFVAGSLCRFGSEIIADCRMIVFGLNVFCSPQFSIGAGGGSNDPWAIITVGDECFLGEELVLNTCRPILIGREVFVTRRAMLMTHNIGHSVLDGFENRFAPIVVEDRALVGLACVVYAGTRIGKEAIVGSNSYVAFSVPKGKLAMGVPAKVVGESSSKPTRGEKRAIADRIVEEFRVHLHELGVSVIPSPNGFAIESDGRTYAVAFHEAVSSEIVVEADESVIWTLNNSLSEARPNQAIFDLQERKILGSGGILYETSREFLRKRGLKFTPTPWRYNGGFI